MNCDHEYLDRDDAIDAFNSLLEEGNYQYNSYEYEQEEVQHPEEDEDEDQTPFIHHEHIAILAGNLHFVLSMQGPETNFYVRKISPDGRTEFRFDRNTTTMLIGNYPLTNLQTEDEEGSITFNIQQGLVSNVRQSSVLRNLRKIANSENSGFGARYEAKYDHKDSIQIRLQAYTRNPCILRYFSENSLLLSSVPQQDVMFVDLELPMI